MPRPTALGALPGSPECQCPGHYLRSQSPALTEQWMVKRPCKSQSIAYQASGSWGLASEHVLAWSVDRMKQITADQTV